jgi:hypothetical protein
MGPMRRRDISPAYSPVYRDPRIPLLSLIGDVARCRKLLTTREPADFLGFLPMSQMPQMSQGCRAGALVERWLANKPAEGLLTVLAVLAKRAERGMASSTAGVGWRGRIGHQRTKRRTRGTYRVPNAVAGKPILLLMPYNCSHN